MSDGPRTVRCVARFARLLAAIALCIATAAAAAPSARAEDGTAWAVARSRGWGYLMDLLVADGVERRQVAEVFADPRCPAFDGLGFRLAPRESHALYRGFLGSSSVARARMCRAQWAAELEAAEREHGVPASVVAAILHVETGCGRNTGRSPILPALARLAMAAEPENLERNVAAHTGADHPLDSAAARPTLTRARELESIFYPEVRGTFELARRLGSDPLEIRGSGSGAFGIPQFLPTSYLRWGRDGNGDGRVSLYDHADAIASCATYLQAHGWRPGLDLSERRSVIWSYNRSTAYIDTVLALANRIEPARATSRTATPKAAKSHEPAARKRASGASTAKQATAKSSSRGRAAASAAAPEGQR